MTGCAHSWRLIEELVWLREPTEEEAAAQRLEHERRVEAVRGIAVSYWLGPHKLPRGSRRRWYCVRCRTLEETFVPSADLTFGESASQGFEGVSDV